MKRILTALVAATILTTAAHAGHSMHQQHHNNQPSINKFVVPSNKFVANKFVSGVAHQGAHRHDHRDRLPHDWSDFRYCCWLPSCQCYCFWCAADDCWYYWYGPWDCYLPYDQIHSCPPQANVIPKIPGGLPPLASKGDAGPVQDGPPMPPAGGDDTGAP